MDYEKLDAILVILQDLLTSKLEFIVIVFPVLLVIKLE